MCIRISATALSSNSFLRFGANTTIVELTGADFSRTLGSSAGNVRFHGSADGAGSSGFAAVNVDRTVALNGTVQWGSATFNPTVFHLGTAASTHKVTLTTGINLGNATRTINTADGLADVEAEISGALSNGTLLATGAGTLKLSGNNTLTTINKGAANTDTGTLILSGSNTFSTATLTYGTASQNRGAIRLEHNSALGGVTVIAGSSGTGASQARIELANNVTISGIEYQAGGRSNSTTSGAAIVNVSGNNTWAGNIRISSEGGGYGIRSDSGKLTISGELRNGVSSNRVWGLTGAVTVGDGIGAANSAILGGTGIISGAVTLGSDGAIAPGTSAGTLTLNSSVSGAGSLLVEMDGAVADQLIVGGTLDISAMTLDLATINAPTLPVYVIVNAASAITGTQFAADTGSIPGYTVTYDYDDGVDTHNIALVGVPATNPFDTWATTNGLAGADALPGADPDKDGLANLIEFVIGGQPNPANPNSNSNGLAPTVSTDANNLIFTFRRTDLALSQPGIGIVVEYGSDLSGWTTATDGVGGVTVVPTEDHFGAGIDRIVVTIPKALVPGTKMFARLKVEIP